MPEPRGAAADPASSPVGPLCTLVAGYRATERLDQFRAQMAWNQEELEQWAAAQRQKEEDGEAIDRYR